jgi:putative DNA primase/helicase
MVALARSRKWIAVAMDEFDADPRLFNCRSGTVDLRTGELKPHRREDLITRLAPVEYRPDAACPLFDAFLETTFSGNPELTEFVLRVLGMGLTGDVREQHLYIFHGAGNNGKSVLLDTVAGLMGEYASEAPPDLLADRKGERHPTEIADLCGRRLVVASETEENSILRLQLVKRLTGNARIKGRFMRQDFFEFERTHKLVLVTNNKPRIRENTEAAWRRLRLVPFDHIVPKEQRDKKLLARLRDEWPGILAKLVAACIRWQRDGLTEPEAVLVATEQYRKESDEMAQFIGDCCVVSPTSWVASSALRDEYEKWCKERGMRPLWGRAFTERLRERGFKPEKCDGVRGWIGVALSAR